MQGQDKLIKRLRAGGGWITCTAHATLDTCLKPHPWLLKSRQYQLWKEQRNGLLADFAAHSEELINAPGGLWSFEQIDCICLMIAMYLDERVLFIEE